MDCHSRRNFFTSARVKTLLTLRKNFTPTRVKESHKKLTNYYLLITFLLRTFVYALQADANKSHVIPHFLQVLGKQSYGI